MLASITDQEESKGNNLLQLTDPGLFAKVPQTRSDHVYQSGSNAVSSSRCLSDQSFDLFLFLWTGLLPFRGSSLQQNRDLLWRQLWLLFHLLGLVRIRTIFWICSVLNFRLYSCFHISKFACVCVWSYMDVSPPLLTEMGVWPFWSSPQFFIDLCGFELIWSKAAWNLSL